MKRCFCWDGCGLTRQLPAPSSYSPRAFKQDMQSVITARQLIFDSYKQVALSGVCLCLHAGCLRLRDGNRRQLPTVYSTVTRAAAIASPSLRCSSWAASPTRNIANTNGVGAP